MPTYSIYIHRTKCIETTNAPGKDEIYGLTFSSSFINIDKPIINYKRFKIGSFDEGHSIWETHRLWRDEDIKNIDYTLFFVLLYEHDETQKIAYEIYDELFQAWFPRILKYCQLKYDVPWKTPSLWREKLIDVVYGRLLSDFREAAVYSMLNDDELIGLRRFIIKRETLDRALGGKRGEKQLTFTGDGGKYRTDILVYGNG